MQKSQKVNALFRNKLKDLMVSKKETEKPAEPLKKKKTRKDDDEGSDHSEEVVEKPVDIDRIMLNS